MTTTEPASPSGQSVQETWKKGLPSEVNFWQQWIDSKGLRWPDEFKSRLDPDRPLQEHLRPLLNVPEGLSIRILDVGAGPLTRLGKTWGDRRIEILPVDPLADEYNKAMDAAGISPLVRTRRGEAEHLTDILPRSFFDLSYAINCLDHCYDALEAIRQMLLVTRPGAFVHLDHAVNEAEKQMYHGLHQWNFCIEDGHLICWRPDLRIDVGERLADLIEETRIRPTPNWVSVSFKRRSA
jgi:SAM-dependent methyltransferase